MMPKYRECDANRYFLERYHIYGFRRIEFHPLTFDYTLITNSGEVVYAELETRWYNYLQHKHHLNPMFKNVSLLILLECSYPTNRAIVKLLPRNTLVIDNDDWNDWINYRIPKERHLDSNGKILAFTLNQTQADEVARLADFRRISSHEWCKLRVLTAIRKSNKHEGK